MADTGTAMAQHHLSGHVQAWLSRLRLTYILHIHKRHGSENNNNILSGVECNNDEIIPILLFSESFSYVFIITCEWNNGFWR
jgi:hypothetical protein